MKTLARLHQFGARRGFYASNLRIGPGDPNIVSCCVDGDEWSDFGDLRRHTNVGHDYAFLISRRVLDVLIAENLATFDAVRVRIDDIGDLREAEAMPEYYAIKVPQHLELNYYDGIGSDGGEVTYWVPNFTNYEGHPFIEVETKEGAKIILCIPKVSELAEQNKWGNCAFSCLSAAGYYYSKELRRKAETTIRIEDRFVAKEIFVDEEVVRNDLEAAKRMPQGHIVRELPTAAPRTLDENLSAEEIVAKGVERMRQERIKGMCTFSSQDNTWSFPSLLDVYFQKDVPVEFEDRGGSGEFPKDLPDNIAYLGENFATAWNAFAARINELIQARKLPLPDSCVLLGMKFTLYNAPVAASAAWKLEVSIKGIPHTFSADFKGLELQSANL